VTVSTGGVITGFTFVPGAAAAMTSPTSVPLHLLALEKAAKPADTGDDRLRPAIVNVAGYYLRLAQTRTPAQMESLIWGKASVDGADHGPSCAAFASLTLELAAQAVGQQSWVTGGATYPWPLQEWADVRVNPNPDSLGITSIVQDAQAHQRWHPIGDGYQPQRGDWVVFDGHVEVVTSYANGVLDSIGADSLPNLTVNAHSFPDPLAQQGVEGFVDNGHLGEPAASSSAPAAAPVPAAAASTTRGSASSAEPQLAAIPGVVAPGAGFGAGQTGTVSPGASPSGGVASGGAVPGSSTQSTASIAAAQAKADIPGAAVAGGLAVAAPHPSATGNSGSGRTTAPYRQHATPAIATPGTKTQQAFINQIAPGALAAQQRYGVPASVTIAQAIDESGWGSSQLAANDYNLFGIKGSGPAGSVTLPTQEFENGQWVTIYAQFRTYHNVSESISDHAELLATSGYYARAMADRSVPDAFANDLTGVYATDPEYGANLIALMKLYNLYRFDSATTSHAPAAAPSGAASHNPPGQASGSGASASQPSIPGILSALSPALAGTPTTQPSGAHSAATQPPGSGASIPGILSVLAPVQSGASTAGTPPAPTAHPQASQTPTQHPTVVQPSSAQPSATQPSQGVPAGTPASIPGILSALASAPAGASTPSTSPTPTGQPPTAQTPAPQPSATQAPTTASTVDQTSGSQPSGGQASVPGIMSVLSPAATASPAAAPGTPHPVPADAGSELGGSALYGDSPTSANSAASAVNGAAVQGVASVPGVSASAVTSSPQPPSSASPVNSTAAHRYYDETSLGAAAVPGVGTGGQAGSLQQENATAYQSAAVYGNPPTAAPVAAAMPGVGFTVPPTSAPSAPTAAFEGAAAYGNPAATAPRAAAVTGIRAAARATSAPRGNTPAPQGPAGHASSSATVPGGAAVPGVTAALSGFGVVGAGAAVRGTRSRRSTAAAPTQPARRRGAGSQTRGAARASGLVAPAAVRYDTPLPPAVATAFFAKAKGPLARAEQLHRDVAGRAGIRWQLLAACDWMQCNADHLRSPVNGERLGKHNPDGTVYQTKSQALAQCASDLIYLAGAVYGLDLTARRALPVRALADVFAAFRWGGLLKRNGVSAMEFPYSVAGLTEQHLKMHWPVIGEPDAPDKPGSKFRGSFGAVPVLLSLSYPALV
jgi:lysozyme